MGKRKLLIAMMGTKKLLPLSLDFSTYSDGAMPSQFYAPDWVISSGVAKANQTLGTEMLTDPGLEATYTDGLCTTLTKTGTPTVLEETTDKHGGSKAQKITATAQGDILAFTYLDTPPNTWYKLSGWRKRTAGTEAAANKVISRVTTGAVAPFNNMEFSLNQSEWTQDSTAIRAVDYTLVQIFYDYSTADFATILLDDFSFKPITSNPYAILKTPSTPDINITIKPEDTWASFIDSTPFGIVARSSDILATNCILCFMYRRSQYVGSALIDVWKKIGNTYTNIISQSNVSLAANGELQIICSGTTVQVFYNGTQVNTDKTVSDAELVSNKHHGFISTGGNVINQAGFFLAT